MESGWIQSHVPEEFLPQISTLSPGNNPDANKYAVPGPYLQFACSSTLPSGKSKVGVCVIVGVGVMVGVDVIVGVFVLVGVSDEVKVSVGVFDTVGVLVEVVVGVGEANKVVHALMENEITIITNKVGIHLRLILQTDFCKKV